MIFNGHHKWTHGCFIYVSMASTLLHKLMLQGLFVLLVTAATRVTSHPAPDPAPDPAPSPAPAPILPSKLALLYTPLVCPFFYAGKAVKAVQAAVNAISG